MKKNYKSEKISNLKGNEVESGIYKIAELIEKSPKDEAPSNLAIIGRYMLTPKISDRIDEPNLTSEKFSLPVPFKILFKL